MGLADQVFCMTCGNAGRRTGCNDHQSAPARFEVVIRKGSIGSAPQVAPASIHALRIAFSFSGSGCFGGISPADTRCHNVLSFGLPGTITRDAAAFRLRSNFPFGLAPL